MLFIPDTTYLIILEKNSTIVPATKTFCYGWDYTHSSSSAEEYEEILPEWIKPANNFDTIKLLNIHLHAGEASAIALCMKLDDSLLIINERKERKFTQDLGIKVIGSLGILIQAKKQAFITKLGSLDFRISDTLRVNSQKG